MSEGESGLRHFPRSKTPRSKTQVFEGEGPTSSPRLKTQVSEGEGPTSSPRSKTQVSGARRYDICTVPRPLVPTSPAPVPTNPHKALVNVATADVPCVNFELALNTGQSYVTSFCTRLRRYYNDKVHFAFASVHSMTNDSESRAGQAQSTDSNFVYGENVVYVDGEGGAETVVYEGAAPTGTQNVANLTSLPSTPLDYCQEVGKASL